MLTECSLVWALLFSPWGLCVSLLVLQDQSVQLVFAPLCCFLCPQSCSQSPKLRSPHGVRSISPCLSAAQSFCEPQQACWKSCMAMNAGSSVKTGVRNAGSSAPCLWTCGFGKAAPVAPKPFPDLALPRHSQALSCTPVAKGEANTFDRSGREGCFGHTTVVGTSHAPPSHFPCPAKPIPSPPMPPRLELATAMCLEHSTAAHANVALAGANWCQEPPDTAGTSVNPCFPEEPPPVRWPVQEAVLVLRRACCHGGISSDTFQNCSIPVCKWAGSCPRWHQSCRARGRAVRGRGRKAPSTAAPSAQYLQLLPDALSRAGMAAQCKGALPWGEGWQLWLPACLSRKVLVCAHGEIWILGLVARGIFALPEQPQPLGYRSAAGSAEGAAEPAPPTAGGA